MEAVQRQQVVPVQSDESSTVVVSKDSLVSKDCGQLALCRSTGECELCRKV